jgi:hypothetical protein
MLEKSLARGMSLTISRNIGGRMKPDSGHCQKNTISINSKINSHEVICKIYGCDADGIGIDSVFN